jgi:hypothetical protein
MISRMEVTFAPRQETLLAQLTEGPRTILFARASTRPAMPQPHKRAPANPAALIKFCAQYRAAQ